MIARRFAKDLHGCRFGNESRSSLADMRLSAESEGPWSLATAWEQAQDGSICLTYSACKAGVCPGLAHPTSKVPRDPAWVGRMLETRPAYACSDSFKKQMITV